MRKKGWKGKEALMAMTPKEAEDYVNRKDRRANTGQKPSTGGLQELAQKFGDSIKKAREEAENESGDGIDMPMPDRQEIGESVIAWYWDRYKQFDVVARYVKSDDNVWQKPVGTYFVDIGLSAQYSSELSAEQTGVLAGVLASAYKWEGLWRQHAGEYLALDGALEPVESDAAQG